MLDHRPISLRHRILPILLHAKGHMSAYDFPLAAETRPGLTLAAHPARIRGKVFGNGNTEVSAASCDVGPAPSPPLINRTAGASNSRYRRMAAMDFIFACPIAHRATAVPEHRVNRLDVVRNESALIAFEAANQFGNHLRN